jgi:hypothetical protein
LNKQKKTLKRIRIWINVILLIGAVFALVLAGIFYFSRGPQNSSAYKGPRKVIIEKKDGKYGFYKDGKPFLVKGGAGVDHIKELAESGGNTIMCWDTSKIESVLKEAAKFNVEVIIGLDIPSVNTDFYRNKKNTAELYNACISIVTRYKDNPNLLAWCLGNEMTLPWFFSDGYKAYNKILDSIHVIDPSHPVSTAIINITTEKIFQLKWRIPALDFYSINIYNSLKIIKHDLDRTKWLWTGPYMIGEWAPQGGWEAPMTAWKVPVEYSSTDKAQLFYEFYNKYMPLKDPRFLGSVVFYWGNRQEYTQSWFSVFGKNGNPNEIEEALNDSWKDTSTLHLSPKIKSMFIDGMGGKNNIIVTSDSKHLAVLEMQSSNPSDSLRYKWEMYREDWDYPKGPPAVVGLFSDSTQPVTDFRAPQKEGPYRVFVTVYNPQGYIATANIPIYVQR